MCWQWEYEMLVTTAYDGVVRDDTKTEFVDMFVKHGMTLSSLHLLLCFG